MKKKFSVSWKSSKQVRKQRKYRYNAPLHIKGKFLHAHLSKELIKKFGIRSKRLRKGDKVIIMRGQFKKKKSSVDRLDIKKGNVYLTKIEVAKKDGTKVLFPINASNLVITELVTDDKKRMKRLKG